MGGLRCFMLLLGRGYEREVLCCEAEKGESSIKSSVI